MSENRQTIPQPFTSFGPCVRLRSTFAVARLQVMTATDGPAPSTEAFNWFELIAHVPAFAVQASGSRLPAPSVLPTAPFARLKLSADRSAIRLPAQRT